MSVKKAASGKMISSAEVYEVTMKEIQKLMKKGEENLSHKEFSRLRVLARAAEKYEEQHQHFAPDSMQELIRAKILQLRITRNYTAALLGISDTKFSMIMNGKQRPDVYFIKSVHDKLGIDGNLLLKAIK